MDIQVIILSGLSLLILIYSVILHEISHGFVALRLGDQTAKYAGRLTLNPIPHIDPWGTILIPTVMFLLFQFAFGWAKPVPYNPYNLRDQRFGPLWVALSGPATNFILAIFAAIVGRLITISPSLKVDIIENLARREFADLATIISGTFGGIFFLLCAIVIFWNVILGVFNLIPIPPLDGSKIIYAIFPMTQAKMAALEQFGFVVLIAFVVLFGGVFMSVINFVWGLFFGLAIS